ncbi:MAG: baseplate wedge protein 53 [Bacteroidales bacterium]|jgi:hypothetical protein|nr:baseplate wedge protein 53 [Bacteroidales bacterium]
MYKYLNKIQFGNYIFSDVTKVIKLIPILEKKYQMPIYFYYRIPDWNSPEQVSYDWYGDSGKYWLILLINKIINPFDDWLKTMDELEEWTIKKYGSFDAIREPHHYHDVKTNILYSTPHPGAQIITNWDYEYELNEKKRIVKVIYERFIYEVEQAIKTALIL